MQLQITNICSVHTGVLYLICETAQWNTYTQKHCESDNHVNLAVWLDLARELIRSACLYKKKKKKQKKKKQKQKKKKKKNKKKKNKKKTNKQTNKNLRLKTLIRLASAAGRQDDMTLCRGTCHKVYK